MSITEIKKKYGPTVFGYTICYVVLAFTAIVLVELVAKTSVWVVIAIVFLYFMNVVLSVRINTVQKDVLVRTSTLAKGIDVLADAVQMQATGIKDIQDFITRLVRPQAQLPIH